MTGTLVAALVLLAPGPLAQGFAVGPDPFAAGQHRGADFAAAAGAEVRAACAGVVAFAGEAGSNGRVVTLRCGRWRVTHLPLATIAVRRGARVRAGAKLGTVGSSPAHEGLHLGVRREGDRFGYVDPLRFLAEPTTPPPLGPAPRAARPRRVGPPPPRIAPPPRTAPRRESRRRRGPRRAAAGRAAAAPHPRAVAGLGRARARPRRRRGRVAPPRAPDAPSWSADPGCGSRTPALREAGSAGILIRILPRGRHRDRKSRTRRRKPPRRPPRLPYPAAVRRRPRARGRARASQRGRIRTR